MEEMIKLDQLDKPDTQDGSYPVRDL